MSDRREFSGNTKAAVEKIKEKRKSDYEEKIDELEDEKDDLEGDVSILKERIGSLEEELEESEEEKEELKNRLDEYENKDFNIPLEEVVYYYIIGSGGQIDISDCAKKIGTDEEKIRESVQVLEADNRIESK